MAISTQAFLWLWCITCVFIASYGDAQEPAKGIAQRSQMDSTVPIALGRISRVTPVKVIGDSGLNHSRMSMKSGAIFAVFEVSTTDVVGVFQNQRIIIPKGVVDITPMTADRVAAALNAIIIVTKASYSEPNRQGKNVKTNIQKLLPQARFNPLTSKLEIPVEDAIILGTRAKPKVARGMITANPSGGVDVFVLQPQQKILKIEYDWQGQSFEQTVLEGQILSLP